MIENASSCDIAVIGGGIVGLACARELARRHPRLRVLVLEREARLGAHQSRHNSGVIHAGVYYQPGSLKARLCLHGAHRMYAYCEANGIPVRRAGKLIVAADVDELPRLRALHERAQRNGVAGLRWLASEQIAEVEPNAVGVAALHSPDTGIVDYGAVCDALAAELRAAGHVVATGVEVRDLTEHGDALRLHHAGGVVETRWALGCAGGWSDRLAIKAGASPDPRIVPFRGAYLLVAPARQKLVRGLVYPVPDPSLPFLGVHLTRHVDGRLSIGPTALLAASLTAGGGAGGGAGSGAGGGRSGALRVDPRDLARTLAWPGTARMAWRYRRAAALELRHALSRRALRDSAARFVPDLRLEDLRPGFAGVRAQALTRGGQLVDDFVFSETHRALHVRNAPSPGATSSLAIAAHVADRFERRFGLGTGATTPV